LISFGTDSLTTNSRSTSNSSSLLSRMSSISFGSVSVHTHPVILGDNPAVSTGLPVTSLGWKAVNSKCFDIDEYERMCQGRRTKAENVDREAWLREKGYSIKSFERVEREINEIKVSRRQSRGKSASNAELKKELGESASNAEPTKELRELEKELDPIEEYRFLVNATLRPGRSDRRLTAVKEQRRKALA
jgi:hypothetical protein